MIEALPIAGSVDRKRETWLYEDTLVSVGMSVHIASGGQPLPMVVRCLVVSRAKTTRLAWSGPALRLGEGRSESRRSQKLISGLSIIDAHSYRLVQVSRIIRPSKTSQTQAISMQC